MNRKTFSNWGVLCKYTVYTTIIWTLAYGELYTCGKWTGQWRKKIKRNIATWSYLLALWCPIEQNHANICWWYCYIQMLRGNWVFKKTAILYRQENACTFYKSPADKAWRLSVIHRSQLGASNEMGVYGNGSTADAQLKWKVLFFLSGIRQDRPGWPQEVSLEMLLLIPACRTVKKTLAGNVWRAGVFMAKDESRRAEWSGFDGVGWKRTTRGTKCPNCDTRGGCVDADV